jgi:outer membrane protein assembly factor BamB
MFTRKIVASMSECIGTPRPAGLTKDSAEWNLQNDFILLPVAGEPVTEQQLLSIDGRTLPSEGEAVIVPVRSNADSMGSTGMATVGGIVKQARQNYHTIVLYREIPVAGLSGTPVLSKKTGKVIGVVTGAPSRPVARVLFIAPAFAIYRTTLLEVDTNRLMDVVGVRTHLQAGDVKWSVKLGDLPGFESHPIVDQDGIIYLACNKGRLIAFGPDGKQRWATQLTDNVALCTPVVSSEHIIYTGAVDGGVYAVGSEGAQLWRYTTPEVQGEAVSGLALAEHDRLYVSFAAGGLYALTLKGEKLWSVDLGVKARETSNPAISSDGTVYLTSQAAVLHAIAPNGTIKWELGLADGGQVSDPVVTADGTVLVVSDRKGLCAINPDGSERWNVSSPQKSARFRATPPAVSRDGTAYFVDPYEGYVHAVSPEGRSLWTAAIEAGGAVSSPVISAGGKILVNSYYGELFVLDPTGKQIWTRKLKGAFFSSPAIDGQGAVYAAALHGVLYALHLSSTDTGRPQWAMFGGDANRAGRASQ